jgi:very-short-patch-repair endonuclease
VNPLVRGVLDIAETQHGIVTRDQARRAGLSDAQLDACIRSGLLIGVAATGLYRVRGAFQSLAMATVAAVVGSAGAASFGASCRLLRLDVPLPTSPIDVTVAASERQPRLRRLDIAPRLEAEALEAAFERARRLGLVSIEALARRFALIGGKGRPGTSRIRTLLAGTAPNALDSRLEVKAWRLLRDDPVATPVRQVRVTAGTRRYRLDFAWPNLLAAFETEGFEWHGTRAQWKQDRMRTAALERLGWRRVVATWDDVVSHPGETLDRVASMLAERTALIRSSGHSVVPISALTR